MQTTCTYKLRTNANTHAYTEASNKETMVSVHKLAKLHQWTLEWNNTLFWMCMHIIPAMSADQKKVLSLVQLYIFEYLKQKRKSVHKTRESACKYSSPHNHKGAWPHRTTATHHAVISPSLCSWGRAFQRVRMRFSSICSARYWRWRQKMAHHDPQLWTYRLQASS